MGDKEYWTYFKARKNNLPFNTTSHYNVNMQSNVSPEKY